MEMETILNNIQLFRMHNLSELVAAVNQLENLLIQSPNIKLIILDSIAFHFRSFVGNHFERTRILNSLAQTFRMLASKFNCAV